MKASFTFFRSATLNVMRVNSYFIPIPFCILLACCSFPENKGEQEIKTRSNSFGDTCEMLSPNFMHRSADFTITKLDIETEEINTEGYSGFNYKIQNGGTALKISSIRKPSDDSCALNWIEINGKKNALGRIPVFGSSMNDCAEMVPFQAAFIPTEKEKYIAIIFTDFSVPSSHPENCFLLTNGNNCLIIRNQAFGWEAFGNSEINGDLQIAFYSNDLEDKKIRKLSLDKEFKIWQSDKYISVSQFSFEHGFCVDWEKSNW
jgi:hypothetical protein